MLTLCCPFIEYNADVKRTLKSFQYFISEVKLFAKDLKILTLGITSNKKDLQNDELNALVNNIEFIPRKGIYFAYNFSVKNCMQNKSKWLWILGGGDTIYKPNIDLLNALTNEESNENIITGSMLIGNRKTKNKKKDPKTSIWQNLDKMRLNHPAMIISIGTYKKIGLYNEKLNIISDYEWCIKAIKARTQFKLLESTLTYHELGGASTSYGKSRLTLHLSCINVISSNLRSPFFTLIAITLRISRFLISRLRTHFELFLNKNKK
tara:strand:+ start:440 stop:1234 length:795 start_codon:yes stop_codon:yes gene_type:complete